MREQAQREKDKKPIKKAAKTYVAKETTTQRKACSAHNAQETRESVKRDQKEKKTD